VISNAKMNIYILIDRGLYSILGAAAYCGSVTRTVSVAMITLEINGHLTHSVPLMVCVLSSYAISEYFYPVSFFEMLFKMAGLDEMSERKGKLKVKDVLKNNPEYKEIEYLALNQCTTKDIFDLIRKRENDISVSNLRLKKGLKNKPLLTYIPVVDNKDDMNLLFIVKYKQLKEDF